MTPEQKKAHQEMMEVLKEIEFWLKRIAKKLEADKHGYTQDEIDQKAGIKE